MATIVAKGLTRVVKMHAECPSPPRLRRPPSRPCNERLTPTSVGGFAHIAVIRCRLRERVKSDAKRTLKATYSELRGPALPAAARRNSGRGRRRVVIYEIMSFRRGQEMRGHHARNFRRVPVRQS